MREFINRKKTELSLQRVAEGEILQKWQAAHDDLQAAEAAQLIMQKAAALSQQHLAAHLSRIVTQAVQAVIEKPYEFVCEFVERRGSTEADLYLVKDGERFDILAGTGGGLADVCSFSLKVAYLLLSNVGRVLIIDEVSRHINSPEQRRRFAEVLVRLSAEFNIQVIVNTTIPELVNAADRTFTLSQKDGATVVKTSENPI